MDRERFERNWGVSVDALKWEPARSDYYNVAIPDTKVAAVGPFEVWDRSGDYTVTRGRVTCTFCHDLRQYLNSTVTRTWKVYGNEGHRQRESFNPSSYNDFSSADVTRIIEVINADATGTNEYSIIRITRNTAEECEAELDAQLSDGVFENSRYGIVEEVL